MSTKIKLDGRTSSATGKVIEYMRKARIFTRPQIIEQYMALGKDKKKATYLANMVMTPRLVSKHGDPRGSVNHPCGHQIFLKPLARTPGEDWRFEFHYRKTALTPLVHGVKIATAQKTKVETKASTPTKVTETA